ncbi:hypothetical protein AB1N83_007209 [Pleurotus pulmonarius]
MSVPLSDIPVFQGILSSSIGALSIGAFFSICLFGANSPQSWYYYQHYPTDATILKSAVAFLWFLEATHTILICHAIYFYTVLGFGSIGKLETIVWSIKLTIIVTGLLTLTTQSFFAWRVHILSKKRPIPLIIICMAIGHAAFTWAVAGIAFGFNVFTDIPRLWENLSAVTLALGGATNLSISLSLGYYLHHARSGIAETDKLINKLIFWALNVGILTSIADFTVLILILTQNAKNLDFIAVYEVMSNLYAASMLATLNTRRFTREHVLNEHGTIIHLDPLPAARVKICKSVAIDSDAQCTVPSVSSNPDTTDINISGTKGTLGNSRVSDEEDRGGLGDTLGPNYFASAVCQGLALPTTESNDNRYNLLHTTSTGALLSIISGSRSSSSWLDVCSSADIRSKVIIRIQRYPPTRKNLKPGMSCILHSTFTKVASVVYAKDRTRY